MKSVLSSIDVAAVVSEWQLLVGKAKIDQIYVYDSKTICIRVFIQSLGKRLLRFELPNMMYLSEHQPPSPLRPPGSTMQLRKLLNGARIVSVEQPGLDRTVLITCRRGETDLILVVELFDKGNLIVLENGKIRAALEQQFWTNRSIKPGKEYVVQTKPFDVLTMSGEQAKKILQSDDAETITKALATTFGLGGQYATELCARANVDVNAPVSQLTDEHADVLLTKLKELLSENDPAIYMKEKGAVDADQQVTPQKTFAIAHTKLQSVTDRPSIAQSSFNKAIDLVYGSVATEQHEQHIQKESKANLTKSQRILASMAKQKVQLAKDAEKAQAQGTFIYEHFTEIEQVLQDVLRIEKTDANAMQTIKEKYPKLHYDANNRQISITATITSKENDV